MADYQQTPCVSTGLRGDQAWAAARELLIPPIHSRAKHGRGPMQNCFLADTRATDQQVYSLFSGGYDTRCHPRQLYKPYSYRSQQNPLVLLLPIIAACCCIWARYRYFSNRTSTRLYKGSNIRTLAPKTVLRQMDDHYVLSLQNLRAGRYYTLLTYSLTHYDLKHLAANMVGLISFGPRVISLYGFPNFLVLWMGCAVAGGVLMTQYWTKIEKSYIVRMEIGDSAAISGLATVMTCVNPWAIVSIPLFPPMPAWLETSGMAAYSLLAMENGWSPEVGHLGHFGGMAFGAFWWLVALRPIPVRQNGSFY